MKIKPCPFCGGEAQVNERYRSGTANRKMYWISCSACGISQQHDNTSGYRYQSKAIDRWNRRKPLEDIVEQLEKQKTEEADNSLKLSLLGERERAREHSYGALCLNDAIEIVKGGAE